MDVLKKVTLFNINQIENGKLIFELWIAGILDTRSKAKILQKNEK